MTNLRIHPAVKRGFTVLGKALFAGAFWLLIWYLVSERVGIDLIFPSPKAVLRELWLLVTNQSDSLTRYIRHNNFWLITLTSLLRVLWGVLLSVILGTALAYLTSRFRLLNILMTPILSAVKSTPVASFILVAMLWFEKMTLPVFITALIVVPIIWANVSEGIRSVDVQLLQVAKVYRFSHRKIVFRIYLPTVAPYFFAACQSSLGMAWKAAVAAEILAVPEQAIGSEMYYAKALMQPETLFAWTLIVIVLSLVIEKLLVFLLQRMGRKFHIISKGERHASD